MVNDMTHGSPTKLILKFALPMLVGNVFQQFYNMVDSAVVGKFVGVEALAAVGCTSSIVFLMTGFAMGVASGFSVVIAQRFGAKDRDGLRKAYATTLSISAVMSIMLTAIALFFASDLLEIMKTPAELIPGALEYLNIVFAGLCATIFYNTLSGVMRALGDSTSPLIFLIVSSLLNVALDLLFVIKFNMAIAGVAYATVISQLISSVLCLARLYLGTDLLRLKLSDFKPDFEIIKQILKIGLPMGFQMSITAMGVMLIQSTVNAMGTIVVAAYSAATKIEQLVMQPALSFGVATATFSGQNFGAGKLSRIREVVRRGVVISVSACVVLGALLCIFSRQITGLFLSDEEPQIINAVLDNAQHYIWVCSSFVWVLGLLYIYRNSIQGMGNSAIPFLSGIAELVIRVIMAKQLSLKIGFWGVCWSSPIAWIAATVILCMAFYIILNSNIKKQHATN